MDAPKVDKGLLFIGHKNLLDLEIVWYQADI